MKNILIGILIVGLLSISYLYVDSVSVSSPQNYFVQSTHAFYKRVDKQLSYPSVLFIGDSMIQGLAVSEISQNAVNFGIGTDTVGGVNSRLKEYSATGKADCIFIHVGINDLLRERSIAATVNEFKGIFSTLSTHPNVLIGELLPVKSLSPRLARVSSKITAFNVLLASEVEKYDNVSLVNQYNEFLSEDFELSELYHNGDGLHLSTLGNRVWIRQLRRQLREHQCGMDN